MSSDKKTTMATKIFKHIQTSVVPLPIENIRYGPDHSGKVFKSHNP